MCSDRKSLPSDQTLTSDARALLRRHSSSGEVRQAPNVQSALPNDDDEVVRSAVAALAVSSMCVCLCMRCVYLFRVTDERTSERTSTTFLEFRRLSSFRRVCSQRLSDCAFAYVVFCVYVV